MQVGFEDISKFGIGVVEQLLESVDVSLRVNHDCLSVFNKDLGRVPETWGANRVDLHRQF